MKKGIIMEMDESYLTLLTPEGEFCLAHKLNIPYSIGEEIHFFPIMEQQNKPMNTFKGILKLKSLWMSTAVLLIFLGTVVPIYQSNKAYAYVSIDVNPSIELGLNKDMKVVELTGYNKEGKNIVSQISDWKKRDVSEITNRILQELKSEGFVKNEPIIISTVPTEKLGQKVEQKLEQNMKEIKQTVSDQQLEVNMVTTTEAELEKAHNHGVTAGKYQEIKKELTNKKQNKTKKKNNNWYTEKDKGKNNNKYTDAVKNQNENSNNGEAKHPKSNNGEAKREDNNRNNGEAKNTNISNYQNHMDESNRNKIPPGQLKKQATIKKNDQVQVRESDIEKQKEKSNENGKQNNHMSKHSNDKRNSTNKDKHKK